MADASSTWRCPHCRQADGEPYLTTTVRERPGVVMVLIRCRGCHHEWQLEHHADAAESAGDETRSAADRD